MCPCVLIFRIIIIVPFTALQHLASPLMCLCSFLNNHHSTICSTATVYPKKHAHGFCFAVLCCGYTLTDFPISIRLTSLALWQSNDCPSASKATLMNMDKPSCELIMNDCVTTTKQSTTKPCAYFFGYTVAPPSMCAHFPCNILNYVTCFVA